MTWCKNNPLLYLYVDEDALNVLILQKPFKRFHKVLLKREGILVHLSCECKYWHACLCMTSMDEWIFFGQTEAVCSPVI